jgi:hypothetical protein
LVDRSNEHTSYEAKQQTDGFESLFHVCHLVCFDGAIITKLKTSVKQILVLFEYYNNLVRHKKAGV